jgi:hypothetical protein
MKLWITVAGLGRDKKVALFSSVDRGARLGRQAPEDDTGVLRLNSRRKPSE